MRDELKDAVKKLADKSASAQKSDDAMKYSQAACNVANALATVVHSEE